MTSVSVLPRYFFIFCYLVLLPLVASRQNGYQLAVFQKGRFFFWSADAPMMKELAKFPAVVQATDLMLSHFVRVENATLARRQTGKVVNFNDAFSPCNNLNKKFGSSAKLKMGIRGWPAPDASCVSDTYGTQLTPDETPPYTSDDLFEALYMRGKVVKDNIQQITRPVIDNFTNPDFVYNWQYETQSQRCVLHVASGFRIESKWFLTFGITSQPKNAQLRSRIRINVHEYLRVNDGNLNEYKNMCLPVRPEGDGEHHIRTDTTTVISTTRGVAPPSEIQIIQVDENSAIHRALDQSDVFIQQAHDALTPSNIAILVLPLLLNAVPIALLAEVSTNTMLLYTLMSDVLTVVPLAIKGGELISIGTQRHRVILTRMTSSANGTRPAGAGAALFGAECRAHDNVLPAGIVFLALSIVFMIGGIIAEVWARRYEARVRKYRLTELKTAGLMFSSGKASKGASSHESSKSGSITSKVATTAVAAVSNLKSRRTPKPVGCNLVAALPAGIVGTPFFGQSYDESYNNTRDKNV